MRRIECEYLLVVRFLHVTELEHPSTVAFRDSDGASQLLHDLRIGLDISAALTVGRCKAFSHEVSVDACEGILSNRGIGGINKAEMKERAFAVVDIRYQFSSLAQRSETVNGLWVVLAVRFREFHKTVRCFSSGTCSVEPLIGTNLRRASCA
jgi:hypothetical protein